MRLPSLKHPDEFIEVPRWIPDSADYRHLDGKRVFAETGGSTYHALKIGRLYVHGPNADGLFAVDLAFPCPDSVTSLKAYIYHLSKRHLERLCPVHHDQYEFTYEGVLYADRPFTSSFENPSDVIQP